MPSPEMGRGGGGASIPGEGTELDWRKQLESLRRLPGVLPVQGIWSGAKCQAEKGIVVV